MDLEKRPNRSYMYVPSYVRNPLHWLKYYL